MYPYIVSTQIDDPSQRTLQMPICLIWVDTGQHIHAHKPDSDCRWEHCRCLWSSLWPWILDLYGELLLTVAPHANAHPISSYRSLCSPWIAVYGMYPTLTITRHGHHRPGPALQSIMGNMLMYYSHDGIMLRGKVVGFCWSGCIDVLADRMWVINNWFALTLMMMIMMMMMMMAVLRWAPFEVAW